MRGTLIRDIRRGTRKLLRDQRGNAMMLTAAAIVPIIGIVGSGIDIGRAYMAELRLQQACDAGVLAGRRSMAAGQYNAAAIAQANTMFRFNYPDNIYGSTNVAFSSQPLGTTDVRGTATARLPTAIMYIFGMDEFNLSVDCAAKLEISNTDMMLVLDVTGSMEDNTTSDGKKRMAAMREAAKQFFQTMTTTDVGDGRLRFGIVPYASTVNVGHILRDKNPAWLSDYTILPSRSPVMQQKWGSTTSAPAAVTNGTFTDSAWTDIMPISGFASSSACTATATLSPPGDSAPVATTDALNMNKTARWLDQAGTRVYSNDTNRVHHYYNYRYAWTGGKCVLQRRTRTYTQATAASSNATATFRSQYRYEDRLFNVAAAKSNGGTITVDTGDNGSDKTVSWSGCIIERRTTSFAANATAPSDALDMDVDSVPTADEATKWQLYIPEITYMRAISYNDSVPSFSTNTTKGIAAVEGRILTVNSSRVSSDGTNQGNWVSFPSYWSQGGGVCPDPAQNLTTMTAADSAKFNKWIDDLDALGGTYHDAGMAWGIRLMSPIGLFAAENAENAPGTNNRPIGRHIIFMTDGQMAPSMRNFSTQGYEYLMQRVGGSFNLSDQTARHNNRFNQLCETAKNSQHKITIWVIAFGEPLNDQLISCASPGDGTQGKKAYQTNSGQDLNDIFKSIAGQISRLRLSQ